MFFLIIIVKSHKQVLIKTILQDLLKDKTLFIFSLVITTKDKFQTHSLVETKSFSFILSVWMLSVLR